MSLVTETKMGILHSLLKPVFNCLYCYDYGGEFTANFAFSAVN